MTRHCKVGSGIRPGQSRKAQGEWIKIMVKYEEQVARSVEEAKGVKASRLRYEGCSRLVSLSGLIVEGFDQAIRV